METAAEFHDTVADALALPDSYGRTMDALGECLSDNSDDGKRTVLLWDAWAPLARAEQRTFTSAVDTLRAKSSTMCVLLRGEGPDLGLPSID